LDTLCKSYEGSKVFLVDVLELFLPSPCILILETYTESDDGSFRQGTISGAPTLVEENEIS